MRFCHFILPALALLLLPACSSHNGKKVTAQPAAAAVPTGCVDLSGGYAADTAASAIYYRGRKLAVSDVRSFRVLAGGYAADDSSGYFEGKPFRAQFPGTLAAVGGGYAKDRFGAYYRGREIATAQASTFMHVSGDTARDQLDIYVKGMKQYSR